MQKTVKCGTLKNISVAGRNFTIAIPFEVVDSAFIGKPEQDSVTEHHQLVVSIGDIRQDTWNLPGPDLMKVLFEFGRRYVENLIRAGALPVGNAVTMPMITTATHREDACPFNPAQIQDPSGMTFTVEVDKAPIGFRQ